MRHWKRAPRSSRGIIVTRASVYIYMALPIGSLVHVSRAMGIAKVVLLYFIFHLFPSSARDISRRRRYVASIVSRAEV